MLRRLIFFLVLFAPCASYACGCGRVYRPPVAHSIRVQEPALNPVAKHPVVPRRVASAGRRVRY
ncbi:MAG: hypothetical protein J6W40_03825 [Alphaproteobacteria bacterium]|nr:hypothetical protein [Alphaproteobacteria bacterium]